METVQVAETDDPSSVRTFPPSLASGIAWYSTNSVAVDIGCLIAVKVSTF